MHPLILPKDMQNKSIPAKFLSFLLGFTSIIFQIILLRELIVVFSGNEIAYAVVLSAWLFWVSVGSFIFSKIIKVSKDPESLLIVFCGILSLLFPLTLVFIRSINVYMGYHMGEIVGIAHMAKISFLSILPAALLFGGFYSLLCRVYGGSSEKINLVYIWESIGSAIGGFIFSIFLINWCSSMSNAANLSIIVSLFIAIFLFARKKYWLLFFPVIIVVFCVIGSTPLDNSSTKVQWKDFDVIASRNSIYGDIVLTKLEDEYSVYQNGLFYFSTNDPLTAEESVHYAMLQNPNPKNILLIGGGMGGAVDEILKYKDATVDYFELDPTILDVSEEFLPESLWDFKNDMRVNVVHDDARRFIKRTSKKYDVIIVNLGDPVTAFINRYYTYEFFEEASRLLPDKGVLSLSVSSSENYISDETAEFLSSIKATLSKVFKAVVILPGDSNVFIASEEGKYLSSDSNVLAKRIEERGIHTKYVNSSYLPFNLSPERVQYISSLLRKDAVINTDSKPIAYLYDIILWSTHFNEGFSKFFKSIRWIQLKHLFLIPLLILFLGYFLTRRYKNFPVTLSISTTGFSEIMFQVIVILAFQSLYGYAYYKIGVIVSSFMLGIVIGSFYARRIININKDALGHIYKNIQLSICLYPIFLIMMFALFRDASFINNHPVFFASVFSFMPIVAGFIGGMQYPIAVQLLNKDESSGAVSAGVLYAFDVFGASVGAILTGTLLVPLLGINAVCVFCASINVSVLILLLVQKNN